jgi:hypothetical protein
MNEAALRRALAGILTASIPLAAAGAIASACGTSQGTTTAGDSGSSSGSDSGSSSGPGCSSGGCCLTPPPPSIFPFDASVLASIDASTDDGTFTVDACTVLCPSNGYGWPTCYPFEDAGVSLIACTPYCVGRRTSGIDEMPPSKGHGIAAHLAEMAYLEAASVPAFRRLRRELAAHGAPRRLVRAAERAARDEVRHARMLGALARRHGAKGTTPTLGVRPVRNLEAIAQENVVEGCVREMFGALVGMRQAATASDPLVREAMGRIACDETRHAALAFQVDAWIHGRLDGPARERVVLARAAALRDLANDIGEAPADVREQLGLPSAAESRQLIEQMARIAA